MAEAETKFCNNCKKQIAASNFMMHEMHCKRHISLCQHCNEPIPKGEMDVHYEETHAKMPCPKCGVEVEKRHLEEHEETTCVKKPMNCVYCELEFPKNEFDEHIDYCGSRTEQCHKCQQYIKLRDQVKHDESSCKFPEVKPTNNDRPNLGAGSRNGIENEYLSGPMNSFTFDEFSRVLGQRPAPAVGYEVPYSRLEQNVSDGDRRRPRQNVVVKRTNKPKSDLNQKRVSEKDVIGRQAAGNGRQAAMNGRQATESRRQATDSGRQATESDYDRLLAMHLAQDLNQEEDIDSMMRALEKPQSPISPSSFGGNPHFNMNHFSEDMVMIPCEFCDEQFVADDLVQHQSGCSLDRIEAMLPTMISPNNRTDAPNNTGNGVRSPLVQPPAIINNLRNFQDNEWIDDTAAVGALQNGDDDDLFLPCEFCFEMFPVNSLVQHQALCESNVTPRVTSPAQPLLKPKKKTALTNSERITADFPNLASKRHQPPPGLSLNHDDSDEEDSRRPSYSIGATHRVLKPATAANGASSKAKVSAPGNIRSTLRKYGVESQDRADPYTRRDSSRTSADADTDSWLQSSAISPTKRTGIATRTRSTLDNILNDTDESSSHDLLGHLQVGHGSKSQRNGVNGSKQRVVPAQHVGTRVTGQVKTSATAKDVQHQSSRNSTRPGVPAQPKNRTNKPNFEVRVRPVGADEPSTMIPSQRPRARADNAFGASSTSKQPKRRPENS